MDFIGKNAATLPLCFETWGQREFAYPHRLCPCPWQAVMAVGVVDGHMESRSRARMRGLDWPGPPPPPYKP